MEKKREGKGKRREKGEENGLLFVTLKIHHDDGHDNAYISSSLLSQFGKHGEHLPLSKPHHVVLLIAANPVVVDGSVSRHPVLINGRTNSICGVSCEMS